MQSFGDDTLFADINIENKCSVLREQSGDNVLRKENGGDAGRSSKQSLLVSEFSSKGSDVGQSKLSHSTHNTKGIIKQNESDFAKYFEDSILFRKINRSKNVSSASTTLKGDKILSSEKKRSPRENKRNIDTNSIKKHPSDVINSIKKCNKSNTQNLQNGSHDNINNATSDSSIAKSLTNIDSTCDREISTVISLSPAICTQDRCKLASWGLPPNILQVLSLFFIINIIL